MSDSVNEPTFLELTLTNFLDLVSSNEPAPAGGSVAALATAMAAALCVKAARLSANEMPDALDIAATGGRLRDLAATLCELDATTYRQVVTALRRTSEPDPEKRRRAIAEALSRASDVPLEVVEIAADVVALAARIAESGNPNLLGDAITAALLAEAGARSAAALVAINLEGVDDERPSKAAALLTRIAGDLARTTRAGRVE